MKVWYVRDPIAGIFEYSSEEEARHAAEAYLQRHEERADSDCWPEDIASLEWGELLPTQRAQVEAYTVGDDDVEFWRVRLGSVPKKVGQS